MSSSLLTRKRHLHDESISHATFVEKRGLNYKNDIQSRPAKAYYCS